MYAFLHVNIMFWMHVEEGTEPSLFENEIKDDNVLEVEKQDAKY